MHNLWDYTRVRKSLLSKKIYLLVSLCEEMSSRDNKKPAKYPKGKNILCNVIPLPTQLRTTESNRRPVRNTCYS